MIIKFDSNTGLVPAIVQDAVTNQVLMLGYMNQQAIEETRETKKVTFYSRSKQRLWTKGEESGNYLNFIGMKEDCDSDTLLIKALPEGPTCHKGTDTCWGETNDEKFGFLSKLIEVIKHRKEQKPEESYVASLMSKGINKVAQKVGEEAVELVIEAKDTNDDLFLEEAADLLFHYLVLLETKELSFDQVVDTLKKRHK